MDKRTVWLLVGHDGSLVEYTACKGKGGGQCYWRGHLYSTRGKV